MIEMMGELVAGILDLIQKKELNKATEEVDTAFYQMLDHDAGFFKSLSLKNLTEKLMQDHNYTSGHLEILSELFYVQAELFKSKNNFEESLDCYRKSLELRLFVDKQNSVFSFTGQSKISSLKENIKELELK